MLAGLYALRGSGDALLARFEAATREDKVAERAARRFKVLAFLSGVVTVGAGFSTPLGISLGPGHAARAVWVASMAAFAILTVAFAVLSARHKRHDLDDRKLEAVRRFLKVLRADIPQTEPVRLRVDFRDYKTGGRIISREGSWFARQRLYVYAHPWLQLGLRLADGNGIRIAVTQYVKRKEKRKRKYTKVRVRAWSSVVLAVGLAKPYGTGQAVAERLREISWPGPLALRGGRARGRRLRLTLQKTAPSPTSDEIPAEGFVDADDLLRALRCTYRGISAARRAA